MPQNVHIDVIRIIKPVDNSPAGLLNLDAVIISYTSIYLYLMNTNAQRVGSFVLSARRGGDSSSLFRFLYEFRIQKEKQANYQIIQYCRYNKI